ncbi:Est1 DNA/RNA-binding domain-containing protein 1 [Elsinoe fawcettii]|nr:Est1 DNA/RNA-binding domain-containing protein 1 [Elsinoe fawcettii]
MPIQIARLSLEEGPSDLIGETSALAALIEQDNACPPSKKRTAKSDTSADRAPAPKLTRRQGGHPRQRPLASLNEPAFLMNEFQRGNRRDRTVFDPKSDPSNSRSLPLHSQTTVIPTTETPLREVKFDSHHGVPSSLKREASSSSISKDQLFAEVKGLYRSLEIVEQRCIRLDQGHMADKTRIIKAEGWQALTGLHRTLLYEHHDFLLASQHPSAPPELRALASERQIPFRMWKYAIHAYLELLRQHLPESLEFMEAFIYLSYQMMALLYETVTLFEDVWTECLGDLARYRMAIENASISERKVWTDVARYWYTTASDRQPTVGRLYHHLGVLARLHLPQQLYFYSKSLCSVQPFGNAKHSLKAVFEAANTVLLVKPGEKKNEPLQTMDATFVHMHSLIYEKRPVSHISIIVTQVQTLLRDNVFRSDKKWKQYGVFLVISNIAACFSYGASESPLRRAMKQKSYASVKSSSESDPWLKLSIDILSSTTEIILSVKDRKFMLPLLHVLLVLLDSLCDILKKCNEARALLMTIPWVTIVTYLNDLAQVKDNLTEEVKNVQSEQRLIPHTRDSKPLMEDFALRGLFWCMDYLPDQWFQDNSNDDLPFHEPDRADTDRAQRCLWLAIQISARSDFLHFDKASFKFDTHHSNGYRIIIGTVSEIRGLPNSPVD